ncbi:DUF2809 domain-containing protein [Microbacterium sp. NPDC057407]|uniref:DUF2809 domain-containing protein n=1 Tax=Microbacterium sp. NPDC057407 TaxID=3346120 RepID=UPI0036702273
MSGAGVRHPFSRPALRRLVAAGCLAATIVGGLAVHQLLPDTTGTDIAGDALYAVAAYLAVVILAPRLTPLVTGSIAAAWCVAVELFQLTGIPEDVGSAFAPAMLILGTVFDARDLVIYVIAAAVCVVVDAASSAAIARRRAPARRE